MATLPLPEKPGKGRPASFRSLAAANARIGADRELVSWLHHYYARRLIEERAKVHDLLDACRAAKAHVEELREAWARGCISEHDGLGGTRSNRNVQVVVQLRNAIEKAQD